MVLLMQILASSLRVTEADSWIPISSFLLHLETVCSNYIKVMSFFYTSFMHTQSVMI